MSERTMFIGGFPFGPAAGTRSVKWSLYRLGTQSGSEYYLAVFEGDPENRALAVLERISGGPLQGSYFQDSAPLVGGRSLFEVSSEEWVGKELQCGTARTSPVASVAPLDDPALLSVLTAQTLAPIERLPPRPQAPPPPERMVSPEERLVEYVEDCAKLLHHVLRQRDRFDRTRADEELARRLALAVMDTATSIDRIGRLMKNE